jgi:hypothetical protein
LEAPQQCRAENDSRANFANYFRLPELHKNVPQQLSKSYQKQQKKKNRSEIGVRHAAKDAEMLLQVVARKWLNSPVRVSRQ